MGNNRPITIGRIDYTNVWPIFHYFDEKRLSGRAEVLSRVPSLLNRALREGELDIAAISSFAYAHNAQDYLLMPDLSVSARGRVNSILLFLKKPLNEVLNGKIALTDTSATSVNLLKIIMNRYFQASPQYETMEPSLDKMLEAADAALLIGDSAIRASWSNTAYEVIDLGELWHRWTGYGMTFAVIAVRKEAAAQFPDIIAEIHGQFLASKQRSLQHLAPLVDKASQELGGEPAYWQRYFSELHYDFGAQEQAGLDLYFRYAKELGLLDHEVDIQYWSDQSVAQVKE
ncbi:menaquinone biosynthesis protein [Paenibacillus abyssi]|uniref:Chorismate dehydratase n=1 Tax=Paenibacillus abyssi TaxID=1340531 RepID=A0A917CGY8_9BACL|nr:menaquinone biosynthesis protein [Paenibacillus abyssi]GGF88765.1 chorismate dehydratase [Paenibacillus abyssi]